MAHSMNNKKICLEMKSPVESSEKLSNPVTINDFSPECLAEIFSHLDYTDRLNIEDVCTRWQRVGSELSWKNVKVFNESLLGGGKIIWKKFFQRCGKFLTKFSSSYSYATSFLHLIAENCPNLVDLKIKFSKWNQNDFVGAFDKMKKLKILCVDNTSFEFINGYTLLKNLPETIEEFFTESVNFDSPFEQDLEPLSKKLVALHHLTLDTAKLDDEIMEWIINKTSLVHLDLESSSLTGCFPPTAVNLPNLEYLQLTGFDYIVDDLIINFIKNCKKLKYFNMDECPKLDSGSLCHLAQLENLEELYLSDQSDAVTDRDVENIKNLKIFNCSYCPRITDRSIMKIITNSSRLEDLNVCDTKVTATTLEHAASICKARKQKLYMAIDKGIKLKQEFKNDYLFLKQY